MLTIAQISYFCDNFTFQWDSLTTPPADHRHPMAMPLVVLLTGRKAMCSPSTSWNTNIRYNTIAPSYRQTPAKHGPEGIGTIANKVSTWSRIKISQFRIYERVASIRCDTVRNCINIMQLVSEIRSLTVSIIDVFIISIFCSSRK